MASRTLTLALRTLAILGAISKAAGVLHEPNYIEIGSISTGDETCGPEQYYNSSASRCRNCSDLSAVFQNAASKESWLARDLNQDTRKALLAATTVADKAQGRRDERQWQQERRRNRLHQLTVAKKDPSRRLWKGTNVDAGDIVIDVAAPDSSSSARADVLSRLISIDSTQDREYMEYIGNQDASELAADDESTPLSSDDDSLKIARKAQRIISRFIRSDLIGNELLNAMHECRHQQNLSACQFWSNLCVTTMYSHSDATAAVSSATLSSLSLSSMASAAAAAQLAPSAPSATPPELEGEGEGEQESSASDDAPERAASSATTTTTTTTTSQRSSAASPHEPLRRTSSRRRESRDHNMRRANKWNKCKQFSVDSICNSLRDWHKSDKKSNLEMDKIFANDESALSLVSKIGSSGLLFKPNQAIQLLAYRYSYDGNLIGISQFGLSDMHKFCLLANDKLAASVWAAEHAPGSDSIRMSGNAELRCRFGPQLANVLANKHFNETLFIDLYIAYPSSTAMFIKPVPILIKNLVYNGALVNKKNSKDLARCKLVHRFFLQASLPLSGAAESSDGDAHEAIVYAKSAKLELKFRRQDRGALLSSILMQLEYGFHMRNGSFSQVRTGSDLPVDDEDRSAAIDLETSVSIQQVLLDMASYKQDLDLAITILCILSSIYSLIRCYNLQKCYGLVKFDLVSLIRFLLIACNTIANVLAGATLAMLLFLFGGLKFQLFAVMLAPSAELEEALMACVRVAALLKLFGFGYKLHTLLNVDIFFIDWERPKMLTSAQVLNQALYHRDHAKDAEQPRSGRLAFDQHALMTGSQEASFWRPYTIMNRWLQMQTMRRQSLTLQLFLFVCIVETLGLTDLATSDSSLNLNWSKGGGSPHWHQPNQDQQSPNHVLSSFLQQQQQQQTKLLPIISAPFKYLIMSLVYLSISLAQTAYNKYFHEHMVRHRLQEFVDLCSIANVSVFCMKYPRLGYYIHGRNANGTGDCSISDMNALLEREERDLCSKRGLAPNSDEQTFIMILPRAINDHYRKLLVQEHPLSMVLSTIAGDAFDVESAGKRALDGQWPRSGGAGGGGLLRSALSLSQTMAPASQASVSAGSSALSSHRAHIEIITARNKTINTFLINFLEHVYKDIDYSIRERRSFENLALDLDFDEEMAIGQAGAPLMAGSGASAASSASAASAAAPSAAATPASGPTSHDNLLTAATFRKDHGDSFASILIMGNEFDLIIVELFSLLILDSCFGQPLAVTSALVWLLNQTFIKIYTVRARANLVAKAMVDAKLLWR